MDQQTCMNWSVEVTVGMRKTYGAYGTKNICRNRDIHILRHRRELQTDYSKQLVS